MKTLGAGSRKAYEGLLVLFLLAAIANPAHAVQNSPVTARVRNATCDSQGFRIRVNNPTDHVVWFTAALYKGYADGRNYFLRSRVPARGTVRGWIAPDWRLRKAYEVDVFRTRYFHPRQPSWVRTHLLAYGYANLSRCA